MFHINKVLIVVGLIDDTVSIFCAVLVIVVGPIAAIVSIFFAVLVIIVGLAVVIVPIYFVVLVIVNFSNSCYSINSFFLLLF